MLCFIFRKEPIAIDKNHSIHKQVELEVKPLAQPSYGDTLVQPVQDNEPAIIYKIDIP